ncbi:bifunctional DNA-formamidopyrimidine glycosylase/DNA-(apurinic or apyrimidinic site) lyase [Gleimia europaea]|uniref:Formamidopyrimidine-DNA glycosylase n=1 Tax=Gleimia europaea ACS-120-V-Col10b TaxID=883069 RepID=A0A9W5VVW4_9ACTO|nr:bifunctional DNA-formamidopyrimidine glycosylase/DNA-(apurinic or apyrimidinic site) lyase [Gleimia europaea]EPD30336.1 formamidopyrimidine-DNA glycosylase [Gleimia europaea ACS-120-V-Col10b]
MPELPEVETIRMGLAPHIVGQTAVNVTVWGERTARNQPGGPAALEEAIRDKKVEALARRGKFLWAELDSGNALVFHLGMSGQLRLSDDERPRYRHEHARIVLSNGRVLSFVDQRTFGRIEVCDYIPTPDGALAGQGATLNAIPQSAAHIARDPLDPAFDPGRVVQKIRASKSPVKNLLLHQEVVSGIGNIYADEALFAAGVHGKRRGKNVRVYELRNILEEAEAVMRRSIEVGGTSFDELYVNTAGEPGYFARSLAVYGRTGQPCRRCGASIAKVTIGGRSHHFCPVCQSRSRPRRDRLAEL